MDFHDVPAGITAKHVAEMHQADLKIEHKYNCRGLTYWCDERRQTAFCLIEAPNKQAIIDLHRQAHGDVPQRIIEVNDTIVESFLGRIEDPEKSQNTELNIINDPAFRTLMVVRLRKNTLRKTGLNILNAALRGYNKSIVNLTITHQGRVVKQEAGYFLMSFANVTNAIECAHNIMELHNCVITPDIDFKIGMSAGIPVTQKEHIFEDTILMAQYLSDVVQGDLCISSHVKDLYESENQNSTEHGSITVLSKTDANFVLQLMEYTEAAWMHSTTTAADFGTKLGYSKSKLYRTMMAVIGKSPKAHLKDYRLQKALELMDSQTANISEIAYRTGFSSPAYFSKCFNEVYGMLPSAYAKQMANV
jgi:AraC-like DNA-binding protein